MRIGLELSFCICLYALFRVAVPWEGLGVTAGVYPLLAWFLSCILVSLFDQIVLCRPVHLFRGSYVFELRGHFDKALELLELVSPDSDVLVPCPKPLYHMRRAEIFTKAGRFQEAESELLQAKVAGIHIEPYYVARSELFRAREDYSQARLQLEQCESLVGKTPNLRLERALTLIEERKDLRDAKLALKEVLSLPNMEHISGESTHNLAGAFLQVTRLWTGEAEEGLLGLNKAIDQLKTSAFYLETLRPTLASLLIERAYYQATHKAPEEAVSDFKRGYVYCLSPHLKKLAAKVREELEWRYKISLA